MPIKLSATRLDLGNARLDNADFRGYSELQNALSNVSGATTIDLSLGMVVTATVTAATTFSVTNIPSATQFVSFTLVLTNGGRFTTTWMSGTKWQNSVAPTLTVNGTDALIFFTTDGGATWRGTLAMPAFPGAYQTGSLFVWGGNSSGELGLGDAANRSSPVQVTGTWTTLLGANLSSSGGVKSDGSLWMWGSGASGQSGLGDTISRSSPVQLAGTWSGFFSGSATFALRQDRSLWGWGTNGTSYYLGLGDTFNRSSPVQLAGTWVCVSANPSSSGSGHRHGIKTDLSLWGWGGGTDGAIGDGAASNRNSPVQIPGTWCAVGGGTKFSLGLTPSGSLWTWGDNYAGQLGHGDTIKRSSPVQLAGTWASIGPGWRQSFAIKSDGSLWVFGLGANGALGLGNEVNQSSPVQLAGTWTQIVCGNGSVFGIKQGGSLWAWGWPANGVLGVGNTIFRSSPTQIAGTWLSVAASSTQAIALRQ